MSKDDEAKNSMLNDDELVKPIFKNGKYDNPFDTWHRPNFRTVLKWMFATKNNTNLPSDSKELDKTLPVHLITDEEINEFIKEDPNKKIKVIWFGHATCLVNFENVIILMDPVFSNRCSPSQIFGPKRFRPVPMKIDRLPRVDAVIISHNHYDHLDYNSVIELNRKFGNNNDPNALNWFVGRGTAAWFHSIGITKNVHDLNWWESKKFKNLEFVFTPSQHWCQRRLFDRNECLWGSWTILGPNKRFFFGGDTGYCNVFPTIGKKYGPFDISFIPIGAYEPRWMMEPQHVDPEQAVQIHQDVKSRKSVAVHWGAFALANEFYMEPKAKLAQALEEKKLDKDCFITVTHGETNKY